MPITRWGAAAAALATLSAAGCAHAPAEEDAVEAAARAAVARRIAAYNAHDLEAFLAAHAEDIDVQFYPRAPLAEGREGMRAIYEPIFARGTGTTEVHGQAVQGRFVASSETLIANQGPVHIIFIYEVEDGLISAMRVIYDEEASAGGAAAPMTAQEEEALDVVARRADAFNRHDLESFLATHAEDLKLFVYPDRLLAEERAHIARIFGPSLARGEGALEARSRWVVGNVVVSDQILGGEDAPEHLVTVFTVEDDVISAYRLIEDEAR